MRLLTTNKLSDNQEETPEGYLVCKDVPIGRCGTMLYGSEAKHFVDHTTDQPIAFDGVLEVHRTEDVVFAPETLASFQGKPVTVQHPGSMLDPTNVRQHEVGTTLNVRRGEGALSDYIIADLLIKDQDGIAAVRGGMRGVSCGYDASYRQLSPGRATQDIIRGNHVAIVPEGRGGKTCYIGDEIMADAPAKPDVNSDDTARGLAWLGRLFGGHAPAATPTNDAAPTFDEAKFRESLLADIGTLVDGKIAPLATQVAELKPKVDATGATTDAAETAAVETRIVQVMPDLEVLKPGIPRPTATADAVMGAQRDALNAAVAGEYGTALKTIVRGDIATMDAASLDTVTPAAAALVRALNDAKTKPHTGTGGQSTMDRNADANTKAKSHWGAAAGNVA